MSIFSKVAMPRPQHNTFDLSHERKFSMSTGKQLQGQAPQYQLDNPMVPFMDTKVKQAQTNNLNTAAMKNIAGANLNNAQRTSIIKKLASEVTMAEEGSKQSKIQTFIKELEKAGKAKYYLANMAENEKKAEEYMNKHKNKIVENTTKQCGKK